MKTYKTYTFNDFKFTDFSVDNDPTTILTDDKLWISLFNSSVPEIFRQMALDTINDYISQHQELTFDKSDYLVVVLQADMTGFSTLDERFSILIFIYNENEGFKKDCIINRFLLLNESYFTDFRKLVMAEVEQMLFGK